MQVKIDIEGAEMEVLETATWPRHVKVTPLPGHLPPLPRRRHPLVFRQALPAALLPRASLPAAAAAPATSKIASAAGARV